MRLRDRHRPRGSRVCLNDLLDVSPSATLHRCRNICRCPLPGYIWLPEPPKQPLMKPCNSFKAVALGSERSSLRRQLRNAVRDGYVLTSGMLASSRVRCQSLISLRPRKYVENGPFVQAQIAGNNSLWITCRSCVREGPDSIRRSQALSLL